MRLPSVLAWLTAGALTLSAIETGRACPICMGRFGEVPTLVEELMAADQIAVAKSRDGKQFEIWEVLRGDEAQIEPSLFVGKGVAGRSILLTRAADTKIWKCQGPLNSTLRNFVEKSLPVRPLKTALDQIWQQRLDLFEADLGSPDDQIGSSAWSIWAGAPYHVLAQRQSIPALEKLRTWVGDDLRPSEDNLWWTLLGLHGEAADQELILQKLETAWSANQSKSLAALASAHLAAVGEPAVPLLTKRYLQDRNRELEEIQAVVQALGLHGEEFPKLRPAILAAFREFLKSRRPLGGLVAQDLATWEEWEDWPQFAEMLSSGEPVLPATRAAIIAYLRACPSEGAATALKSLKLPEEKPPAIR